MAFPSPTRSFTPTRTLSVLLALGVAVSLAACDSGTVETKPTATAEAPEPSATAETPTAQRPALTELVLTTEGLGDLVFGQQPPAGDPASELVSFDADACAGTGAAEDGLWVTNYPNVDEGFGPEPPFAVQVDEKGLRRIDVNSAHIITADGLGVGSSIDAVLGTYPGGPDEVLTQSDISEVYVFMGEKGKLLFEVAKEDSTGYWDAATVGTVVFLSAVSIDTPAFAKAASDNVIGVCNLS